MNYEVLRHQDSTKIGIYKGVLENAGIPVIIKNWECSNITEVPIPALYPAIFAHTKEDWRKARELLDEINLETETEVAAWVCPNCGETNEGHFAECWNCQTPFEG